MSTRTIFGVMTALAFCLAPTLADERVSLSKDALAAFTSGARINVSFHVCDSNGKPVEGALVDIGLSQKANGNFKDYSGQTDVNGNWTLEAKCSSIANARIRKEGHYETRVEKRLFSADYAEVNSRITAKGWQTWEQSIVLKEQRNPIPMYGVKKGGISIPRDTSVGFDFEKGEPVKPYGGGKHSDVILQFSSSAPMKFTSARTNSLTVLTPNRDEGFIMMTKDPQSKLVSVYECPDLDQGYVRDLDFYFSYTYTNVVNRRFQATKYLLFRSRVVHDKKGLLVSARYGKIYYLSHDDDPDRPGFGLIQIDYRFNPEENNRNVEYDGTNLTTGKRSKSWVP